MWLFVGAAPGSNISNALITVRVYDFLYSLTVDAGSTAETDFNPPEIDGLTDIELCIESANRQVSILGQNIPVDAKIVILGSKALRFEGHIYHRQMKGLNTAPACTLRCTPQSSPMMGPGCRECEVRGLVFKLCC